jgi:hypothetical protein
MRIKPTFSRAAAILFSAATAVAVVTAPLSAQGTQRDADLEAVESFHLTAPVLAKLAQVQENMFATVKAHPGLMKKYASRPDDSEEAATIDQMAKKLDRMPEMKAAVIRAGFTPRDYMIATMATFQAAMTSAVLDMPGADRSRVPANAKANADFLKAHAADFQRIQARSMELQKLMKEQSGAREDSSEAARDTTAERR